MKKSIVILLAAILYMTPSIAQFQNNIKVSPFHLANQHNKQFGISYERMLNPKFSAEFGLTLLQNADDLNLEPYSNQTESDVAYGSTRVLVFFGTTTRVPDNSNESNFFTRRKKGWTIESEFKFYPFQGIGKKQGGFYTNFGFNVANIQSVKYTERQKVSYRKTGSSNNTASIINPLVLYSETDTYTKKVTKSRIVENSTQTEVAIHAGFGYNLFLTKRLFLDYNIEMQSNPLIYSGKVDSDRANIFVSELKIGFAF